MTWTHFAIGALGILALIFGILLIVSPKVYSHLNKFAFSIEKVSDQDKERMTRVNDWERYLIAAMLLYTGIGAITWLFGFDLFRQPFAWIHLM